MNTRLATTLSALSVALPFLLPAGEAHAMCCPVGNGISACCVAACDGACDMCCGPSGCGQCLEGTGEEGPPSEGVCPSDYPVACAGGKCCDAAHPVCCGGSGMCCDSAHPVCCGNGMCGATEADCQPKVCTGDKPVSCGGGKCCPADRPNCCGGECHSNDFPYCCADGSACDSAHPFCCAGGGCAVDEASCSSGCPDGYVKANVKDSSSQCCPVGISWACNDGSCDVSPNCHGMGVKGSPKPSSGNGSGNGSGVGCGPPSGGCSSQGSSWYAASAGNGCCYTIGSCTGAGGGATKLCTDGCLTGWYETGSKLFGPCKQSDQSCLNSAAQSLFDYCDK